MAHIQAGKSFSETARILQVSRETVRKWVQSFSEKGLAGLTMSPGWGARRKLAPADEPAFLYTLQQLRAARDGSPLSAAEIRTLLAECFHARYSLSGVYALLRRLGVERNSGHHPLDEVFSPGGVGARKMAALRQRLSTLEAAEADRQRAETKLRQERDLAQKYLDVVQVILVVIDAREEVVLINQKGCQLLGYPEEEVIGRNWFDHFLPPAIGEQARAVFRQLMQGQLEPSENYENPVLTRTGAERFIAWHNAVLTDETGRITATLSSGEDITEQRQTEGEHARMAAIVETSDDAIIGMSLDRIITSWNRGAERIYGYSAAEAQGASISMLIPPEQPNEIPQILARIERGERIDHYETVRVRKDGQRIHVSLTSSPVTDAEGRIVGTASIARDVTTSKKLEEQLFQAQKMESIGRLAGGIAHDFNNQLGIILFDVDTLLAVLDEDNPLYDDLLGIRKTVLRSADLTRQLLLFSRKQPVDMRPVALDHQIDVLQKMLRRFLGEDITIRLDLDPDLWTVQADPGNIDQMLINMALNTRDAMPEGGVLKLGARNVTLDETYCHQHPQARPGRFICLTVADTGAGMDEEVKEHLFEPFFTTKGVDKGTGLGLSVVYGIVQEHQGWIDVESQVGQGSCFEIYLPALEGEVELGTASPPMPSSARRYRSERGERILLVEDESGLRERMTRVLEESGYAVHACHTAAAAAAVFQQQEGDFDLILSDVVLPDGRGQDMVFQFLAARPDLAVLMVSGYTDERSGWERIRAQGFSLLQKPFSITDLLEQVHRALEQ